MFKPRLGIIWILALLIVLCSTAAFAVAPTVRSVLRSTPAPIPSYPPQYTNADTVTWKVTFDRAVLNVSAEDFTVTKLSGSAAGYVISDVTGGPAIYYVTVTTGTALADYPNPSNNRLDLIPGDGEVRLDVNDTNAGTDITDVPVAPDEPAVLTTGYNTGEIYTIDKTHPFVTIDRYHYGQPDGQDDPTVFSYPRNTAIRFTVTFSEPVIDFTADDVTASVTDNSVTPPLVTPVGCAVIRGTATAYNGKLYYTEYTVEIHSVPYSGRVTIHVNPLDSSLNPLALDRAGNGNQDSIPVPIAPDPDGVALTDPDGETGAFYDHDTVSYGIVPHITRDITRDITGELLGVSPKQTNCADPDPTSVTFLIQLNPYGTDPNMVMDNHPYPPYPYKVDNYGVALVNWDANGDAEGFGVDDLDIRIYDAETADWIDPLLYPIVMFNFAKHLVELPPYNKSRWNLKIDGLNQSYAIVVRVPAGVFHNNNANTQNFGLENLASDSAPPNWNFPYRWSGYRDRPGQMVPPDPVPSYDDLTSINWFPHDFIPLTNWIWYDVDCPTVTLEMAQDQQSPTAAPGGVIRFLAKFSEPMVNNALTAHDRFTADDVRLSGTAGADHVEVTEIQNQEPTDHLFLDHWGMGYKESRTYNVVVSGMSRKGTVIVNIPADIAQDPAGNWNYYSTPVDTLVNYDPAPTVTINQAAGQADPTSGSPINFTAVFSKPITGFDSSVPTVAGTASAGTTVVVSEASPNDGTTYNVAVSGMTTPGTIVASIPANVVRDAYRTVLGDTANQLAHLSLLDTTVANTHAGVLYWNLTNSGVTRTLSFYKNSAKAPADLVAQGSGPDGTITITQCNASGIRGTAVVTYSIDDIDAENVSGAAGKLNYPSTSTDATVVYDDVAPTVTIDQAVGQPDPTQGSVINYTVVFSEPVTGFEWVPGYITLLGDTGNQVSNVSLSGLTTGNTAGGVLYWELTNGLAGMRTLSFYKNSAKAPTDLVAQGSGQDGAIAIAELNASGINGTAVITYSVDDTDEMNVSDDRVTSRQDVMLSGTAGATTAFITPAGDRTYNVAVSGMTTSGTVIANIAAGVAFDLAGKSNLAATHTDNQVTYYTPLSVIIDQAVGQVDPTNTSPILFTAIFNRAVMDFATGDVSLSGTAGATTAEVTASSRQTVLGDTGNQLSNVNLSGMTIVNTDVGTLYWKLTDSLPVAGTRTLSFYRDVDMMLLVAQGSGPDGTITITERFASGISGTAVVSYSADDTDARNVVFGTYNIAVTGMPSSGTVIAAVGSSVAHDSVGFANEASTSTDNQVSYDISIIGVTIVGQAGPTPNSPIRFFVTFTKPVTGFTSSDVALAGTAGATTAFVTGSGANYEVAVSGMTGDGTVIATIAGGLAYDDAGNANQASKNTDNIVVYDATPPAVTINPAAGQLDPTTVSPINFTVEFSEAVADFATGDVTLGGTAGASTAVVTGSSTTYNVAVSGMTGQGRVIASIAAGVAQDAAGNASRASTSAEVKYNVAPTVTINQATGQADPTSGSPINFSVVFSEAVSGFEWVPGDASRQDVSLSGTAGATTAKVSGSGATYNVAVTGMTGSGTVIVSIPAGKAQSVSASVDNLASSSTDDTVTYDVTRPSVTINQSATQSDPTPSSPIDFTVVFSEPVVGFAAGDVTLTGTALANTGTVTQIAPNNGTTYNVAVTGMTKTGTVVASISASIAQDAVGNTNQASTFTDKTVNYFAALTVTIEQAVGQADPTNADLISGPIRFTTVFSREVLDFVTAGDDVTISGTSGASAATITDSGDHKTFEVSFNDMVQSGTVIATIGASVAHDANGYPNEASTSTDNVVSYDVDLPTVTVEQAVGPVAQADPTNSPIINFTVVFNKPVADFTNEDVTIGGNSGASIATVTPSGGVLNSTYNVAISGMRCPVGATSATVTCSVGAAVAQDASGNPNMASTSTDNTVIYDNVRPSVTINQAALPQVPQADPTPDSPINFTVVFSEPITIPAPFDVHGGTAGVWRGVLTQIAPFDGTTFNCAVTGMTGPGTVVPNILANVAVDAAGNLNTASTSTDNVVNYYIPPTCHVTKAASQANPAASSVINYTVTFDMPMKEFRKSDLSDVVLIDSTVPGATYTVTFEPDTGSGQTFNVGVTVTGATGDGWVIARVPQGAALSAVGGYPNAASYSNVAGTYLNVDYQENWVFYDMTRPTVSIDKYRGQEDPTLSGPIDFLVSFSEDVTGFTDTDVDLSGSTCSGTLTAVVTPEPGSLSQSQYKVSIAGMASSGNVKISIPQNVAQDRAGNGNSASSAPYDDTVAYNPPLTVTINQKTGQADPTNARPINFTVVFSGDVNDFTTGDVTLSGTAGATIALVTGSGKTYNVAVDGMTAPGTVIASVGANVAQDVRQGYGNAASSSVDHTVTFDNGPLTVTIDKSDDQADPTSTSPINFKVVFSKPVSGFASSDVDLSTSTVSGVLTAVVASDDAGAGAKYKVSVTGMTSSGNVTARIPANIAQDAVGTGNTASTSTDNIVGYTPSLTVAINKADGQADPSSGSPVNFTVVFSENVSDFVTGDVTLSGSAGATTAVVTGGGRTYNVAVTGMTGSGSVIASIASGKATVGLVGNSASTSTDNNVDYDVTRPSVTINQSATQSDPTTGSPISFTVMFSEPVVGFATGDVSLTGTALATTATVTQIAPNNGTTYNVAVTGMTRTGTVVASISASIAQDAVGNTNQASTFTDKTVNYVAALTVTIEQAEGQADPTNADLISGPIRFTAVFSREVADFVTADGDVTISGTSGASAATITNSSGDLKTFEVSINDMVQSGTVIATIGASVAHDANGFGNEASTVPTGRDNVVNYDVDPLTVTVEQAVGQADPTNSSIINFTVVFNKPVADFGTGDVTLAGASIGTVTGLGTTYNVAVSGTTGDGTVVASIAADKAHDAAGNANAVSTSTDNRVVYDATLPSVTINQAALPQVPQADPTPDSPINFTVVFDEVVTDFATGDVTLGGTAGATTAVVTGIGTTYNVAVSGMTGQGTVTASIAAGVAHDAAGNANRVSTSTDNKVTYIVAPTVTIKQASSQADPTSGSPISFSVVFSEPVTGFATGDVTIGGTAGATTATVSGSGATYGATYNVAVTGMTRSGTVIVSIAAGVAKSDSASVDNLASTSTDDTVTYDTTRPTVTINQATTQSDPTASGPINFTVVFSGPVTGFATGDVIPTGTAGATTATVTQIAPNDGTRYNVAVSGMVRPGTVITSIAANVAASLGNGNDASTSTDNEVTYRVPLTVTIQKATTQLDPASSGPIVFTVVFNKPVSDFTDGSDVTVAGTAPFGKQTVLVANPASDYRTYDVSVYGMSGSGTVIASIAANVSRDSDGVGNLASLAASVRYSVIPPTVTIDRASDQVDPARTVPIKFTVVFSVPVIGFSTDSVIVSGSAGGARAVTVTPRSTTTYDVFVGGMTTIGTVIAEVAANAAIDEYGTANIASTSTNNVVGFFPDYISPSVTINKAQSQIDPALGLPVHFTVEFSEPVAGFGPAKVTLGGTSVPCVLDPVDVTEIAPMDKTTYDVAVKCVYGEGTVIASIAAGAVSDPAGNPCLASTSQHDSVTLTLQPSVTIIQAVGQGDPTAASPINFTVAFNTPVADFTDADVAVNSTAGSVTWVVTGGPKVFNVAVSGMSITGTVTATIPAGVAHSASGLPNTASTSTDNQVSFDNTPLTVAINQAVEQADPTNGSPINFTVVFSKPVTGFEWVAGDVSRQDVSLSGTAGATTAVITPSGNRTYNVAVSGMTGDGTVIASIPAGKAQDDVGNTNQASTSAGAGNTVVYDLTAPAVTINKAVGQADPTTGSPINFTVVFSEVVTDFATGDVTLGGTAHATTAVVTGSSTTYNVAVSGMTGQGTVIASIAAGIAHDAAGNANTASTLAQVNYNVAPTVTINQASGQADPTSGSPINFSVVFSEPVSGFVTGDVTIGGTAGATTATVSGSGATYNVAVTGMTGSGTVIVSIAAGVAKSVSADVDNLASTSNATVFYDITLLTVTVNKAVGQADPTNGSPVNFAVVFSKPVADFGTGDVTLTAGTAGASIGTVTGSGTTYNVAVSGMTGEGTVIASIAADMAHDAAGNANAVSTSTDNTVVYDATPPAVTINQAAGQADPTNASPVNFTAVFSKDVSDFVAADVTLGGTAGAATVVVTGSGKTYNVIVSGMTASGTVIISIAAGVAHDALGNANTASTSTDPTITFDTSAPSVAIISPVTTPTCTRNGSSLSMSGTASDTVGIAGVAWSDEHGNRGTCTGTDTWSATGITVHAPAEKITVTATDRAGNTATTSLTVSVVAATPGAAWTGMAMVSVPLIPDVKDPKVVVGFDGNWWHSYMPKTKSYATYPDARSWFDPQASTPGRGFWAYFTSAAVPVGTLPDQTKSVVVSLYNGWNLIGQPFIRPIGWDRTAIKVRSGVVTKTLAQASADGWVTEYAWGWHPDSTLPDKGYYYLVYDPSIVDSSVGQMDPWQGYWMRATVDCEIEFPAP